MKNCTYCHRKTEMHIYEIRASNIYTYFCNVCSSEYVYFSKNGDLFRQHLYVEINGKYYRWTIGNNIAYLYHIGDVGVPGMSTNGNIKQLAQFKDFPEITPQNIKNKISNMLLIL